ncbi:MAG: acyltransferase [Methylobacterium sp.]
MTSTDTEKRAARPDSASIYERSGANASGRAVGRRNRNLQWLRAFAALSVVLYHASVYLDRFVGDDRFLRLFDGRFGLLGVAIFFAISGYLMAEILPRTDPWSFLTHRIVRIYPIFLIVLGSLIVARGKFAEFDLWAMTLVPVGEGRIYYLGVEWTLLFETSFYVFLFACSLVGLKRHLDVVALVWLGILAVAPFVLPLDQAILTPTAAQLPLMAVNAAFAGGLLLPRLIRLGLLQPALAVVAVGSMLLSGAFSFGGDRWIASVTAVLLVGFAVAYDRALPVRDGLVARSFDRLGDWSYALYLCHAPLIIGLMISRPPIPAELLWIVGVFGPLFIAIPYGIVDIRLYAILKRGIDAAPGLVRIAIASVYVASFLAVAAVAAIWGTGQAARPHAAQPVATPQVLSNDPAAPTLVPVPPVAAPPPSSSP